MQPTLPQSLFCKCKNGTPCFDTMFEIEKYMADALSSQKQQWVEAGEKMKIAENIDDIKRGLTAYDSSLLGTPQEAYNYAINNFLALIKGEKSE